jgi:hypothetical protein
MEEHHLTYHFLKGPKVNSEPKPAFDVTIRRAWRRRPQHPTDHLWIVVVNILSLHIRYAVIYNHVYSKGFMCIYIYIHNYIFYIINICVYIYILNDYKWFDGNCPTILLF